MSGRIVKKYVLVMTCKYCCVKKNVDEFVKCVKRETICYDCFENIPVGEMIYENTPVAQLIAQKKAEEPVEQIDEDYQVEKFNIFGFDLFEELDYENMSEEQRQQIYKVEINKLTRWFFKMSRNLSKNNKPEECSICFKLTKKISQCCHYLCYNCASKIKKNDQIYVSCPVCRNTFIVRYKSHYNYVLSKSSVASCVSYANAEHDKLVKLLKIKIHY